MLKSEYLLTLKCSQPLPSPPGVLCWLRDHACSFWPRHVTSGILGPRPGIEPGLPAVTGPGPNHWTARKSPRPGLSRHQHLRSMTAWARSRCAALLTDPCIGPGAGGHLHCPGPRPLPRSSSASSSSAETERVDGLVDGATQQSRQT